MSRPLTVLVALLLLQGLAVGLYFLIDSRRPAKEAPFRYERLSGAQPAPELLLQRDGVPLQLSSTQGKFVLVHFWATWCLPCREELPALLALSRELSGDDRLVLLAISEDRDWKKVQGYFNGAVPPEVVWDVSGNGDDLYEVSVLPDTYLLDPEGRLLLRFGGARDWGSSKARALLLSELNKR